MRIKGFCIISIIDKLVSWCTYPKNETSFINKRGKVVLNEKTINFCCIFSFTNTGVQ